MSFEDVNIASAVFKANPYPFYARLRAEAPVCCVTPPDRQPAWLVTRYDDVAAVLRDDCFIKDKRVALTAEQTARQPWIPSILRPIERNMLDLDPPDHTRLRGLVHKAFTPRLIEELRGRVQLLTDKLLDTVEHGGRMDLIRDYALPIPTTIIAELLGVPAQDRHKFHRWSSTIVAAVPTTWGLLKTLPALIAFLRYLRRLVQKRRADPQGRPGDSSDRSA